MTIQPGRATANNVNSLADRAEDPDLVGGGVDREDRAEDQHEHRAARAQRRGNGCDAEQQARVLQGGRPPPSADDENALEPSAADREAEDRCSASIYAFRVFPRSAATSGCSPKSRAGAAASIAVCPFDGEKEGT
jgi:hypothetical protein